MTNLSSSSSSLSSVSLSKNASRSWNLPFTGPTGGNEPTGDAVMVETTDFERDAAAGTCVGGVGGTEGIAETAGVGASERSNLESEHKFCL